MGKIKLRELCQSIDYEILKAEEDIENGMDTEISEVVYDSRKVSEGCVFVCIKGAKLDSHEFAFEAAKKGAKAIVVEHHIELFDGLQIIKVKNTRQALALMSAQYFKNPLKNMVSIGVTGTKGKTTTTHMIKALLEAAGKKVGMLGTNGVYLGQRHIPLLNTTPESYDLHKYFALMVEEGCEYVIMEASSQGVKLDRTAGIIFDYAIFTNISPDHIGPDEHKDFEEYLDCKSVLFYRQCKNAFINIDDEYGKVIYNNIVSKKRSRAGGNDDKLPKVRAYSFGEDETADYRLCQVDYHAKADFVGISCKIKVKTASDFNVNFGIPGKFNALNGTVAVALAHSLGIDSEILENSLLKLRVNGRMEVVYKSDKYIVLVDYAHNALSMESLLSTLRAYNPKRLVVVFGCGGNRSKDRRYSMGEIAGKNADFSIVTADNSRFERVEDIIADIRGSIEKTGGSFIEIPDRREAIYYAVENACEGDIIAIIGKGHEDYQEINGVRQHFLDSEVVKEALRARKAIKMKGLDSGN